MLISITTLPGADVGKFSVLQVLCSKSVSQNMLNISTIQGLLVILINMFYIHGSHLNGFQIGLIVLIAMSLALQFIIFVLLVVLAKSTEANEKITNMNTAVTSLSGLLLIITSAISILGCDIFTLFITAKFPHQPFTFLPLRAQTLPDINGVPTGCCPRVPTCHQSKQLFLFRQAPVGGKCVHFLTQHGNIHRDDSTHTIQRAVKIR
jgi:hypothetical protein